MEINSLFNEARRKFSVGQIAQGLAIQSGTVDRWIRQDTVPPFYRNDLLRLLGMQQHVSTGIEESDQLYTLPATASACLRSVEKTLLEAGVDTRRYTYVEPGAGCGHFFNLLPPARRLGIEIEPKKSPLTGVIDADIVQGDYLTWTPPATGRYIAIGNPPFGRNGKTALDFVLKSLTYCDFVAFILPPIFNSTGKGSCRNRLHKMGHALLASTDLPNARFVKPDGAMVEVRTVFQIWSKTALAGVQTEKPSCASYVDIYNIYLSYKEGRPSSRAHLADKCDIYIPRSFWASKKIRASENFSDIPYRDGYGLIIKRKKRDIKKFIRNFDWCSVAHVSTNGSMSIRKDIIVEQLARAGFRDEKLERL